MIVPVSFLSSSGNWGKILSNITNSVTSLSSGFGVTFRCENTNVALRGSSPLTSLSNWGPEYLRADSVAVLTLNLCGSRFIGTNRGWVDFTYLTISNSNDPYYWESVALPGGGSVDRLAVVGEDNAYLLYGSSSMMRCGGDPTVAANWINTGVSIFGGTNSSCYAMGAAYLFEGTISQDKIRRIPKSYLQSGGTIPSSFNAPSISGNTQVGQLIYGGSYFVAAARNSSSPEMGGIIIGEGTGASAADWTSVFINTPSGNIGFQGAAFGNNKWVVSGTHFAQPSLWECPATSNPKISSNWTPVPGIPLGTKFRFLSYNSLSNHFIAATDYDIWVGV